MKVVRLARLPDEKEKVVDLPDAEARQLVHEGNGRYCDEQPAAEPDNEFDPSEHTVDEVNTFLEKADPVDRERVLAAEAAGKNRKSITDSEPKG